MQSRASTIWPAIEANRQHQIAELSNVDTALDGSASQNGFRPQVRMQDFQSYMHVKHADKKTNAAGIRRRHAQPKTAASPYRCRSKQAGIDCVSAE